MRVPTRLVALTVAAMLLAGCAAALVGKASRTGGSAGTQRSAPQSADDSRITTAVKSKLIADPAVKGVDVGVSTSAGVVTLRGTVQKAEQRMAAERAARTIKGVTGVRNELRVR
jgi:hyperosmotically inducible periplasmic protein